MSLAPWLSPTSWMTPRLERAERLGLELPTELRDLLRGYLRPNAPPLPEWARYFHGRFGAGRLQLLPALSWDAQRCRRAERRDRAAPFAAAALPRLLQPYAAIPSGWGVDAPADTLALEPAWAGITRLNACPSFKQPPSMTLVRHNGERARRRLTDCLGQIVPGALDELSALARPLGVARPALPLPEAPEAEHGEWVPGVRLLHPRLVWLVAELGLAFPNHPIVIVSGYRPGDGEALHREGRALDLFVQGVSNREVFAVCRRLRDVGCGYYPYHLFVHVDVREFGSGHPAWVDVSDPGAPSRYVDRWPGVLEPREGLVADRGAP